MGHVKISYLGR